MTLSIGVVGKNTTLVVGEAERELGPAVGVVECIEECKYGGDDVRFLV